MPNGNITYRQFCEKTDLKFGSIEVMHAYIDYCDRPAETSTEDWIAGWKRDSHGA